MQPRPKNYFFQQRKTPMWKRLTAPRRSQPGRSAGAYRARLVAALAATALALVACGGGDEFGSPGNFNIGVTVGGQFVSRTPVSAGGSLDLAIRAGETIVLDAGEPAVWTLLVGGSAVSGGAQVFFAGANITATTLGPSTVAVDTRADFRLRAPVPIALVATATFDSVQVATVNLLITN